MWKVDVESGKWKVDVESEKWRGSGSHTFIWEDLEPDVFNNNTVIYPNYSKRRYWCTYLRKVDYGYLSFLSSSYRKDQYVVSRTSTMDCILEIETRVLKNPGSGETRPFR